MNNVMLSLGTWNIYTNIKRLSNKIKVHREAYKTLGEKNKIKYAEVLKNNNLKDLITLKENCAILKNHITQAKKVKGNKSLLMLNNNIYAKI